MTKTDMARVIVQALRNYPELPKASCARVQNMVKERSKANLEYFYPKALEIIEKRKPSK